MVDQFNHASEQCFLFGPHFCDCEAFMCATMGCVGVLVAQIACNSPANRWCFGCFGAHSQLRRHRGTAQNRGGLIIGLVTEYFTSHSYVPTRELASACKFGALFFVGSCCFLSGERAGIEWHSAVEQFNAARFIIQDSKIRLALPSFGH